MPRGAEGRPSTTALTSHIEESIPDMLTDLVTRLVTRDITSLVAFFHKLEARLETFLTHHDIAVASIEADIHDVVAYAEADVAAIKAKAGDDVAALKREIETRTANAAAVAAIKAALPTSNTTPFA